MSYANTSFPKPKDWQVFEDQMRVLFTCVLNDPNTQKNGRQGQKQCGVDVYGYRSPGCLVGIQCKKKLDKKVTDKELRAEIEKAKNFRPKINEFILVTTAARDVKIQETARIITSELNNTDNPIKVSVWGWDDVEEHAIKYSEAWKALDPTWTPFAETGFKDLRMQMEEYKNCIETSTKLMRPLLSEISKLHVNEDDECTPLHGQITTLQDLINDGYAKLAFEKLFKLKANEWTNASRTERFRILVGMASAKYKLGIQDEAGNLLLDAYNECPEHKNARKNQATGYLLINNYPEAAKLALSILEDNDKNAYAAGILIQALINDNTCDDPLKEIPQNLHDTEDVLIAYINFQRCRGNSEWVNEAKSAVEKYPGNRILKLFYSEAILEKLINTEGDAIEGGILKNIGTKELHQAVAMLHAEVKEAFEKEYTVPLSIAHNAALALRISNNQGKAKEILDKSIKQYPDNENLRLQRAVIAHTENDYEYVLEMLGENSSDNEKISLIANALFNIGRKDDSISLIQDIDENSLPGYVKIEILSIRIRYYLDQKNEKAAIKMMAERIIAEPQNISLRTLQIRVYRNVGHYNEAYEALDETYRLIKDETDLILRLMLSYEAKALGRDDVVIDLLKGRIATDRYSDGLHLLITASINSGSWATAHKVLDSVSDELKEQEWFLKAKVIFALKTGDPKAEGEIINYIKRFPNNLEMILTRIRIWQRIERDVEIRHFLGRLNLADLEGKPELHIRLADLICYYGDASKGLKHAYSTLMNNWDNPKAHLAYHSLILLNEAVKTEIPIVDTVTKNTVICLQTEKDKRRYRIENERYRHFENERISSEDDLAVLLSGKKEGDLIELQDQINAKPLEIQWIKHIYLDALHESLEQFNERFPRMFGLQKFSFDPNAPDPMEDMRTVLKEYAETNQRILKEYSLKGIPLSFVAALIGKDPLEAWSGLAEVNTKFLVCRGTLIEREDAHRIIIEHKGKGCILDSITLSLVRHLGVEKAVTFICGPIYTTQSVIDLLSSRDIEARRVIGKKQGFLAWHDEKLVFTETSEDIMKTIAEERAKEVLWARGLARIAPSIPKTDLSLDVKKIIDMYGHNVCDAAIAAEGNDLLLLSEDMGFRIWAAEVFNIPTAWLQPVLILAMNEKHISVSEYCEAINKLVLYGHNYISLNHVCLMHQARKDNFLVTDELSILLKMVGGPSADLITNSRVMGEFINALWQECCDSLRIMRIISEIFCIFLKGRPEDQRDIVRLILQQSYMNKGLTIRHALGWLIGHSFGMPYFDELINMKESYKL